MPHTSSLILPSASQLGVGEAAKDDRVFERLAAMSSIRFWSTVVLRRNLAGRVFVSDRGNLKRTAAPTNDGLGGNLPHSLIAGEWRSCADSGRSREHDRPAQVDPKRSLVPSSRAKPPTAL